MNRKLILKSPIFVLFGAYLGKFEAKFDIPATDGRMVEEWRDVLNESVI